MSTAQGRKLYNGFFYTATKRCSKYIVRLIFDFFLGVSKRRVIENSFSSLFQEPLLQYIMLKQIDNVKAILEEDSSKASQLDSTKKSPLHASAHNGSSEIAGMFY